MLEVRDLPWVRIEEVAVWNHSLEADMDLESIIDEVRDSELFADRHLLVSFPTEANVVRGDSREDVEVVMLEPGERSFLRALAALGHEPRVLAGPELDDLLNRLDRSGHRRRIQEVFPEEGSVVFAVTLANDHAPDIDSKSVHDTHLIH